jgi:hypothetical protein
MAGARRLDQTLGERVLARSDVGDRAHGNFGFFFF